MTNAAKAANAQDEADQIVANRKIVTFALTAGVALLACGYFRIDFLTTSGMNFNGLAGFGDEWLRMIVTGLVIGGGSAGLHDLITKMSKSSASSNDPKETGGTK